MNLSPSALFGFCALVLCKATMKQFTMDFLKGKMVATAYLTFQPYSKLQCVNQCSTKDLCQIAEYNTVTKTCRLSADIPDNLSWTWQMNRSGSFSFRRVRFMLIVWLTTC